jgi:XTP/dITP diphosphohydrolase
MMQFILATNNDHKVKEIRKISKGLGIEIIPLSNYPDYPQTLEDGKTLEENAVKKALEAARYFNKWAIADDSGLEVDYLNGEPGVYSARYAGDECCYEKNNDKLLKQLSGVPKEKRKACFRCVIAIVSPQGEVKTAQGKICGTITDTKAGSDGFGYDPIFFIEEFGKTFAQLLPSQKNKISHRAIALENAKEIIENIIRRQCQK